MQKTCKYNISEKCLKTGSKEDFHGCYCNPCHSKMHKDYYLAHRETMIEAAKDHHRRTYKHTGKKPTGRPRKIVI